MTYRGFQFDAIYHDRAVDVITNEGEFPRWVGRVINTSERIVFSADTYAELEEAFREAVDEYLDACALLEIEPSREVTP